MESPYSITQARSGAPCLFAARRRQHPLQHTVGLLLELPQFLGVRGGELPGFLLRLDPAGGAVEAVAGRGRLAEAGVAHGQEDQVVPIELPPACGETLLERGSRLAMEPVAVLRHPK